MQVKKTYLQLSLIGVATITILVLRIFYLPGLTFNQSNWDDEMSWVQDSKSRSAIDYIFYRDAPGYFVIVPRLIMLLANLVPEFYSLSSLRILTVVVQIFCFAAAATCVVSPKIKTNSWLLIFVTLSITYVEDLNYLHNIGYLFIFPIFLLCFKPILSKQALPPWRLIIAMIAISKPATAIVMFFLVVLFAFSFGKYRRKLFVLFVYVSVYLACYIVLPNRWSTPLNTDPFTIIKAAVNFPWVVFATFSPSLAIGGIGLLEYLDLRQIGTVFGLIVYLSLFLLLAKFRQRAFWYFSTASALTKSFTGLFLISYLLVYVNTNDYWVKFSPLFLHEVPQHLWMRWSAILPFTTILIIASFEFIKDKTKKFIYLTISTQWILLTIAAKQWLVR